MLDKKRPFTRADAVAAGISPRQLSSSRFRRIFRNVYIDGSVQETRSERAIAALLLHPDGAWVSHMSAAEWYGIVVPKVSVVHVSVQDPKDRRWTRGIKPHVAPPGAHAQKRRRLNVSKPTRLFIELASVLDLVDLVVAGDSMIKVFGMKAADLVAALADRTEYWSGTARFAAAFVRDEVDSPMETRLRMLIVLAGLPEPEVNYKIRDENGDVIVRSISVTQRCDWPSSTTGASTSRSCRSGRTTRSDGNTSTTSSGASSRSDPAGSTSTPEPPSRRCGVHCVAGGWRWPRRLTGGRRTSRVVVRLLDSAGLMYTFMGRRA